MANPVVPFYDLGAVNREMSSEILAAVAGVLEGNHLVLGPECELFEQEFADFCEVQHGVGVGNGLDALTLGLRALGVGLGDEVIVPGQTFIATWLAVSAVGAVVVPVDVSLDTGQIDADLVEASITAKTAAIIAVHLFGALAPMGQLRQIADRHGLALVEDAAQAHGARLGGRRAGSLGDIAAFSFYPSKNLGGVGDGGMVMTSSLATADKVRKLRNYGSHEKYKHEVIGINSRLDEVQAAILRIKLRRLQGWNLQRAAVYEQYKSTLGPDGRVQLLELQDDSEPVWHLMAVRVKDRGAVQRALGSQGIEAGVHYPTAPQHSGAYSDSYRSRHLPNADRWAAEQLSLPMGPSLKPGDVEFVSNSLLRLAVSSAF